MKIRKANNKDKQKIKEFIKRNLEEIFNGKARGLEDLNDIDGNFEIFFIAEEGEKTIGTAGFKNEGDARILRMYVDKRMRGKGLGKLLINKIIKSCKGKFKRIFLTTYEQMNSEGFYKRMGFKTIKREPRIKRIWMEMKLK